MLKLNCYTYSFCKSKRKLKGLFFDTDTIINRLPACQKIT